MCRSTRTVFGVLVGFFVCSSLALVADEPSSEKGKQPTEPNWSFKSRTATDAKKRFDRNSKKIGADYSEAMTDAEDQFVRDLRAAMQEATKAADLDDAVKIKTAMEFMEKQIGSTDQPRKTSGRPSVPIGKWNHINAQGIFGTYEFSSDGTVRWTEKARQATGKLSVKDGAIVIVYQDDRIERLTPTGKRMIVEHWYPSSRFPNGFPSSFGYAEKSQ